MKRIKTFENFDLKEGLISWGSRTFNRKELDYILEYIYNDIQANYSDEKLLRDVGYNKGDFLGSYKYKTDIGYIIECTPHSLSIDGKSVSDAANKHLIKDIFYLLTKKVKKDQKTTIKQQELEKEEEKRKRIKDIESDFFRKVRPHGGNFNTSRGPKRI